MASGGFIASREEVGIRRTSQTVQVPDNPKAKLMYYLNSVCCVLEIGGDIRGLRDYRNFGYLTQLETDALLKLVVVLSPDELIGKVFFPSDALCGNSGNAFYELSHVNHMLAVSNSVIVGGQRKRVAKIMTYKMSWIHYYYLQPIQSYQYRLSRIARGLTGYEPPLTYASRSQCCTIL